MSLGFLVNYNKYRCLESYRKGQKVKIVISFLWINKGGRSNSQNHFYI